jgi:hypothetical protein
MPGYSINYTFQKPVADKFVKTAYNYTEFLTIGNKIALVCFN